MTPHPPATAPARSERWRPWRRMDASRRLLARQLWSEKRFFTLTVVLSGAGAMFEGVGVGLLVPFLEGLMRPDKPPMQSGWAWFDTVVLAVQATPIDRLYRVALLILLSVWLRVILAYAASYTGGVMLQRILHRMRVQVFERLMSFSLRFFSKTRGGVLVNAMTNEVFRVNMLISTLSLALLNGSLALAYVAVLVVLSAKLALFTVFFCAGLYFGLNRILVRMRKQGTSLTETNDRLTWTITEALGGIRTINAAGSQRFETGRFTEASSASTDLSIRMNRSSAIVGPVTQGIASTGLIVMVVVAVQFFVLPGAMSVSALLGFLFGLFRLLPVVQQLNGGRAMWAVNRAGLDSVAELLRDDNKPFLHDGPRELTGLREGIRLENVSFGYEDDALVLRDVSVFFPHGKTTAIVGASGAGKSTLIDLAVRFYDPTEGRVLYDGVDVREFKKGSLRQRIAIVSQDTFVFNDTVRSNIAYGLADVPDARIREAAEQANAAGFIEEMEDGYETILGDRGTRLSGGQRQRLAIARAILRDPEILILDEATSALDSVSERQVQDALERLMRERTVVVIAHRLSTVEHADHVIVLEKGRVVEEGAYETLLEQRGQLWAYHSLQFQLT